MRFSASIGRGRAAESRRGICRRGRRKSQGMSQRRRKVNNGTDFTKRENCDLGSQSGLRRPLPWLLSHAHGHEPTTISIFFSSEAGPLARSLFTTF